MTRQDKEKTLQELNAKWAKVDLPLKQVATHDVPGEGNPDTDIMFIGEGPGKNEDEQGRPFVGAAGKFLDELIELAGYKRGDVFIANVIKHRPPGNRDPLPDEIEAYKPWLEEQVAIIQPKLFVTLGRYSMEWMLGPGLSISKIHSQPKRNKRGQIVMPMYHPAAALYRGDLRSVLAADFAKIPKVLKLIEEGKISTEEEEQSAPVEQQRSLL